jgi:hypothetical protein
MIKDKTEAIEVGTTLSIKPNENNSPLFQNFLCSVRHIKDSTAYKTLKKLKCAIRHPVTHKSGLEVTIYFDPEFPDYGFLLREASMMPIIISHV